LRDELSELVAWGTNREGLIARGAPRTGRRMKFAIQINQIRENSRPGNNRGTQRQGLKQCDDVHFDSAVPAANDGISIPSPTKYYDQVSPVLGLIVVVRGTEE
jgi:hypothetical protein